jgi:hypothetical protein
VIAAVEIPARLAGSFGHRNPKEMTMSVKPTKVLVAALVLAATSLTFVANASARPTGQSGYSQGGYGESYMRDRHDATNTNGF